MWPWRILNSINERLGKLVANDTAILEKLKKVEDKLDKIGTETAALQTEIASLKDVIANGPPISPELQAAVDRVATKADAIDAMVDDGPTPVPPAPTP